MYIPIFIKVINPEYVKELKAGTLPDYNVHEFVLKHSKLRKRRKIMSIIFCSLVIVSMMAVFLGQETIPNEGRYWLPIILSFLIGLPVGCYYLLKWRESYDALNIAREKYLHIVELVVGNN